MSLSHGAKTQFLRNLEKFFCHFPPEAFPWRSLEYILRMPQLSIIRWCSHPAGHHLCNIRCYLISGTPRSNTTHWQPHISERWEEDVVRSWVHDTPEGSRVCCSVPALSHLPHDTPDPALWHVPVAMWITERRPKIYVMGHWKQITSYTGSE